MLKRWVLLLSLLVISLAFHVPPTLAAPRQAATATKIDAAVLAAARSHEATDFIIVLNETADLSGAAALPTKAERGQYVYDTLRAHAAQSQAGLRSLLNAQGVTYQAFYISNKIYVPSGNEALITSLAARDDVARIVANERHQLPPSPPSEKTAVPQAIQDNLTFIHADQVWELGITGEGTVLAGNDTGIQWDHPALKNQYRGWNGSSADHNYSWWDATNTYTTAPGDGNGHGTHTSGTMVGSDGGDNQIGVAPGSRLIHCKNLDDGGFGSDADIIECFQWDLAPWDLTGENPRPDLAPDVINNSWGGGGGNPIFMTEIDALQAAGILVEFSAGNAGPGCNTLGSPGDFPQVLTTGSVDHSGGVLPGTLTDFSSRGPSAFSEEPIPDIMAPGENIRSSLPGGQYGSLSGTSMSGPHVTGLVGLMWSANPGLRGFIEATHQIIMQTAVPLSGQTGSNCGGDYELGPNNDWGRGTIDAYAAVQAAMLYGDPGQLTGTISDSSSGTPIPEATVRATLDNSDLTWQRRSDENGIYALTVFSGTYTIEATRYGYFPGVATEIGVTAELTTTVDFALDPAPFYTVSGVVTDGNSGVPLYAEINIAGYPGEPIWTDPVTGAYSIDLAAGVPYVFHVTTWTAGYVPTQQAVEPLTGNLTADFSLHVDTLLCAAPGYEAIYAWFEDFESGDGGFVAEGSNSSWQYGTPSSGPFAAHSGDNVWATNLAGNYNDNEFSTLTSPDIDLSSFDNQNIILTWWEWLQTESCCDYVTVEVSADGGQTWFLYFQNSQDFATGWTKQQLILDPSFAVPNFRVRFGLVTDGSVTMPGFYVDDIGVGAVAQPPALYSTDFETEAGFVASGSNSSWAWGVPTRGPGVAHSGDNVWATNLGGNYNDFETSQLESPTIDLSAGAGSTLQLSWWQWLQTEANVDLVNVEISNDDGATWTTLIGPLSGAFDSGWLPFYTILDPAYAVSTFRVRFTLTTDDAVTYPGLYLDDLLVTRFVDSGPALACELLDGGLVVGQVLDGNTAVSVNGAAVSSSSTTTQSQPTPADDAVGDGFYILFAESGQQTITASKARYATASDSVSVTTNTVQTLDLALQAGLLTAVPSPLAVTLPMGGSETVSLDLGNDGAAGLSYTLRERSGGYVPASAAGQGEWLYRATTGTAVSGNGLDPNRLAFPAAYRWTPDTPTADLNILVYADDFIHTAPQTYPDRALQTLGLPYTAHYDSDFDGFLNSLNGNSWDIVIFANDNWLPPESIFNALNDYAAAGGSLIFHSWAVGFAPDHPLWQQLGVAWVADDFDPPDPIHWWQPEHPVFTRPEEVPELLTPTGFIYGVYGQQVRTLEGAEALAGITDEATADQANLVLANDGRTVFRGFLDGQQQADLDSDTLADGLEVWINLLDGIQTNFRYDIPWFSTDIITGTLTAGGTQTIAVQFDSNTAETVQPGTYLGALRFGTDTPYGALTVPLEMSLLPPNDWGKLTGMVTGLTRCDVPGNTLRGVAVTIDDGSNPVVELTTRGDGLFTYWLPAGSYGVTIAKEGYAPQTITAVIAAGETVTNNVDLRRLLPCSDVAPNSVNVTLGQQATTTVDLTLQNSGAGDWHYTMLESPFELAPPAQLRSAASLAESPFRAATTGPTSLSERNLTGEGREQTAVPLSGWFGGAENPGGAIRYGAAQCAEEPDAFYVISGIDRFFGLTKAVWHYDAPSNEWTSLLPLPTAVEAPAATCYQGRLYVLGGSGSDQFYIFDLTAREWLLGAPLPRGVEGAAAAAWQGKIYLVGGDDDFFPGSGVSGAVNVYDIATDSWLADGSPVPIPVSNMGFVQAANYLYLAGGWGVESPERNETAVQRYDLMTDTWETGPALASGRADFALAATDTALYAFGGDADKGGFFEPTTTTSRLALADWTAGSWTPLGDPLPVPLQANNAGFCTTAMLDKQTADLWSVGGLDQTAIGGRALFREAAGEQCASVYGDVAWLTETAVSGSLAADSSGIVTLTFNSHGLEPGVYHATLVVAGNDRQQWLPVTLTVGTQQRVYLPVVLGVN